jgi:hypothetical protein
VAVSAITQKLKVPARLSAVLNGESLMNDATGLVAFKFALGAMVAGSFSLRSATMEFVVLALGGTVLGLAIGWLMGRLRDALRQVRSSDVFIEVTLSLMSPYAAYLAANALGVSNILAVVAAGLYSGWRDPLRMDVSTRQTAWATWSMVLFWLNGLAFILLGLQLPGILHSRQRHLQHRPAPSFHRSRVRSRRSSPDCCGSSPAPTCPLRSPVVSAKPKRPRPGRGCWSADGPACAAPSPSRRRSPSR